MPTMMFSYLGLPTTEGKDDRGASSPDNPALHIPDPLSITTGTPFSSAMLNKILWLRNIFNTNTVQIVLHYFQYCIYQKLLPKGPFLTIRLGIWGLVGGE